MNAPRQLALALPHAESFAREDFLEGAPNSAALAMIERWPDWPDRVLALGDGVEAGGDAQEVVHRRLAHAGVEAMRFVRAHRERAAEQLEGRQMLAAFATGLADWTEQGPGPLEVSAIGTATGALESIAIHPTMPVAFIGGSNGGIWRTMDITATPPTWESLGDQLESLSIRSVAFSPLDPTGNTIFAGSGRSSAAGTRQCSKSNSSHTIRMTQRRAGGG